MYIFLVILSQQSYISTQSLKTERKKKNNIEILLIEEFEKEASSIFTLYAQTPFMTIRLCLTPPTIAQTIHL